MESKDGGQVSSNITFERLRNNWERKPIHSQHSNCDSDTVGCYFPLMTKVGHSCAQIPLNSHPSLGYQLCSLKIVRINDKIIFKYHRGSLI